MRKHNTEGFFGHGTLLLVATMAGSFCNMFYHVVMGRALDPAEYGVLASMLGIVLIASTPMDALRTALAHYAARLVQDGRAGAVKNLTVKWCMKMLLPAIVAALLGTIFCNEIATFFRMDDPMPVVLTGWVLAGSLLMPVLIGALLGVQAFIWMSVTQHSWGVVRLVAGVGFVYYVAASASWGIIAQGLGVIATLVLGLVGLWSVVHEPSEPQHVVQGVGSYFMQSLVVITGFAVLMNADVLLVKRFFDPETAGLFARAGTIGRTMVFVATPIAMAMFPKVASSGVVSARDRKTLLYAVLYVAVLVGGAAALISVVPWLPLWVIYGDRTPTPEMAMLVRAVAWAMAPLGVSYVLLNFEMAQHRFGSAWGLVGCATGYLVGVAVFHQALWHIPAALGLMSVLSAILLIAGLPRAKTENQDGGLTAPGAM